MILRVAFHIVVVLCLLLMIVCVVGWLRSFDHYDAIQKVYTDSHVELGFSTGNLVFAAVSTDMGMVATEWQLESKSPITNPFDNALLIGLSNEEFSWAGFEYRVMPPGDPAGQQWLRVQHIYMFRMPIWSLIAVLSLPQFVCLSRFHRYRRLQSRIKGGLCLKCGYDLRETTGKSCPECGATRVANERISEPSV